MILDLLESDIYLKENMDVFLGFTQINITQINISAPVENIIDAQYQEYQPPAALIPEETTSNIDTSSLTPYERLIASKEASLEKVDTRRLIAYRRIRRYIHSNLEMKNSILRFSNIERQKQEYKKSTLYTDHLLALKRDMDLCIPPPTNDILEKHPEIIDFYNTMENMLIM